MTSSFYVLVVVGHTTTFTIDKPPKVCYNKYVRKRGKIK
jgi:hypothetical protein